MITLPQLIFRIIFPLAAFMPLIGLLLLAALVLCPPLWIFALAYAAFYYYDRNTPWEGSRPALWFRNSPLWRFCVDYFDTDVIITEKLTTDKNYVIACHPHGVIGVGTLLSFATDATKMSQLLPGISFRLVTLPINFYFPLHREIFTLSGIIASDAESIEYALKEQPAGRAVVIVPGGAEESLDSHSRNFDLTLKNRKGFVRLAIKNGASLVPVYHFGENRTYHQLPNERGTLVRRVQQSIKNLTGIAPIVVSGEGFFNTKFGLLPKQTKIVTVVGAPIPVKKNPHPTNAEITNLHDQYVDALVKLFEEHKSRYGLADDVHLRIL